MATRTQKNAQRKSYSRIQAVMEMPNLIETQQRSYREFLWRDNNPWDRPIKDLKGELARQIFEWINEKTLTKNATNPRTRRIVFPKGTVITRSLFRALEELPVAAIGTSDSDKVLPRMIDDYNKPGLQQAFESVFPIKGKDGSVLNFVDYTLGRPKYGIAECVDRGMTYAAPLRVKVQLEIRSTADDESEAELHEVREEDIYLGEMPLITPKGTFIINGAERVVVSQLHRSPGPVFGIDTHPSGRRLVTSSIIPNRGAWLEFESDLNYVLSVTIDRRKKFTATTVMRAFGLTSDEDILSHFCEFEEVKVTSKTPKSKLIGKPLAADVIDEQTGEILAQHGQLIDDAIFADLQSSHSGLVKIVTSDPLWFQALHNTLQRDTSKDTDAAQIEIYQQLRPGEPPHLKNAQAHIENMFLKPRRYDLSRVGRYRMNRKLGLNVPLEEVTLTTHDLVGVIKYMLRLLRGDQNAQPDDIDHLGNRRVRTIGELLENQIRAGLTRMERTIKEKMGLLDIENLMPRNLVNSKPIVSVINEFFGRSQLSQFLDQINPLAELTHKRRLSALGPGGLNRERAGFEVRDVHHTHYGRICPIETPEGPNIGLISSLSTYARINDVGFIETPYRRVEDGTVTNDILFLEALDEDVCVIAQANVAVDQNNHFTDDLVSVRSRGEFTKEPPAEVDYMDVAPMQLVSISATLVPFLEHDDANRALMGSNMQRQAVPLLKTEAPIIGTGVERKAAQDSGIVVRARRPGKVVRVTADRIEVKPEIRGKEQWWDWDEYDFSSSQASDFLDGIDVYRLSKFLRSNQNTTVNQKPVVQVGDRVEIGDVLADGPATDHGELALGKNVLVAFMSWEGFNFEDAILISERVSREHIFTSVHIEEAKTEARDTKLGEEEITRDIPNVGEEGLKNLDEQGIIRIGAPVKPGDILVGKISPKGKIQTSNVEKLLRAIFGKRAEDVRDISLRASPGTYGTVVDVKVFSRKVRGGSSSRQEEEQTINRLNRERDSLRARLNQQWEHAIREFIKDEELQGDLAHPETGSILLKSGTALNESSLKKLQDIQLADAEIPVEKENDLARLNRQFHHRLEEIDQEYDKQIDYIKTGDNLPPGVIKMVKVYIAKKKKLSVGDKMAGRHGNKGVVSRMLPMEDMPHLEDGTPVDIVLNPLGVPSRMNVGQILETHLGWASKILGKPIESPVFDGAKEREILAEMRLAEAVVHAANYIEEDDSSIAHSALLAAAQTVRAMEEFRGQITADKEKEFDAWFGCAGSLLEALTATHRLRRDGKMLQDAFAYLNGLGISLEQESTQPRLEADRLKPIRSGLENVLKCWEAALARWETYAALSDTGTLLTRISRIRESLAEIDTENLSIADGRIEALAKSLSKLDDQLLKAVPLPSQEEIDYLLGQDNDILSQEVRGDALRELIRLMAAQDYKAARRFSQQNGLGRTAVPSNLQKVHLIDGKSGEYFERETTVGYIYMMKLNHLVDDKIHARSIGPYSLVTQQPLGGKAQFGGQRLGEMEVWALEAYGAAHILQELLTVKSDDTIGRNRIYEAIVKGEEARPPGLPESFYVLVKEIESLGLSMELRESEGTDRVGPVDSDLNLSAVGETREKSTLDRLIPDMESLGDD
ncbi:MAG: DNA-directed RNA polymerase subunit beta [Candidatus Omnitrophica bacterium]|nr:DNA-directed RNA polymerase subunit beta [bacterium]MCC6731955.1 DNA-directed RNA polymerase subunit beta [Candidatus Omnitrophota bacterium]MCE7908778.1 DNA-directed RNA polymerase subunit beta [Candidatus Omnitrophica bacterium COP1]MCK6497104.1 DNA-directed RNA polymerase subunit beta [bacterium]MCL4735944.1 DNA-directed RNA polymerase subunit beta [Candidatus Omnitrophota bacterium]